LGFRTLTTLNREGSDVYLHLAVLVEVFNVCNWTLCGRWRYRARALVHADRLDDEPLNRWFVHRFNIQIPTAVAGLL